MNELLVPFVFDDHRDGILIRPIAKKEEVVMPLQSFEEFWWNLLSNSVDLNLAESFTPEVGRLYTFQNEWYIYEAHHLNMLSVHKELLRTAYEDNVNSLLRPSQHCNYYRYWEKDANLSSFTKGFRSYLVKGYGSTQFSRLCKGPFRADSLP